MVRIGKQRRISQEALNFIVVLIALTVFLVGFLFAQSMFVKSERISSDEIREYVQEYFSEYKYLYDGQNVPFIDLYITD